MGIRLSEEEAWAKVAASHTGIFTTLRRDGMPVPLPLWFVAFDRAVYLRTPSKSKKVTRVRRDPRASFLVESGEAWVDLSAVMLYGEAEVANDPDLVEEVGNRTAQKYRAFGLPAAKASDATKQHYSGMVVVVFRATEAPVSWDNQRVRMRAG